MPAKKHRGPKFPGGLSIVSPRQIPQTPAVPKKLAGSSTYLASKRDVLKAHECIDDLAVAYFEGGESDKAISGILHHLIEIRSFLMRLLWSHEVFLGKSLVDDIVYNLVRDGSVDVVTDFLQFVRRKQLHTGGLAVLPLHSFGIAGAGLAPLVKSAPPWVLLKEFGIAILPQSNNYESTKASLEEVANLLGTRRHVDGESLDHFHRSRSLDWLERNPLLVVTIRQLQDGYYENEVFIRSRLSFCRTLMYMIHALQQQQETRGLVADFSTSIVNNWQTLDLHHYLIFQSKGGRKKMFETKCVPTHSAPAVLVELSELVAQFDPSKWHRRRKRLTQVFEGLRFFERLYLGCFPLKGQSTLACVLQKLFNSLFYFTRSYRPSHVTFDETVYLAVAFEGMLTDHFSPGTDRVIKRRVALALRGVPGVRKMSENVRKIMWRRNEEVHHGQPDANNAPDLALGRETFVLVFLRLVKLIESKPLTDQAPIANLLGDLKTT